MSEDERMPDLTASEITALDGLSRHGSEFEIGGAILRDRKVRDLFNEPGAYDRRILLVTLRSALAAIPIRFEEHGPRTKAGP